MEIIEVEVSDCTESDIVAEDIVNSNGITILAKNAMITDYIKKRLIEIGIENICVYNSINSHEKIDNPNINNNFTDSPSFQNCKRQYKETILLVKNIIDDLALGEKFQYNKIMKAVESISELMDEKGNMINYLNAIRDADRYTYSHCVNVAFYSMLISSWIGLSDTKVREAIQSGLLHDVGKVKIPDKILNKKGKLTDEEFDIMKGHPILGYNMLSKVDDISHEIKDAVLLHHERMDGSGYPFNMTAGSIGLYARIVAIADVFDAMTSNRVYRKKKTPFNAFEMFKTIGVRIFDSSILGTFIKNISPYYTGTNVILNNGKRGRIVYIPPQNVLGPVVEVQSDYLDLSTQDSVKILEVC